MASARSIKILSLCSRQLSETVVEKERKNGAKYVPDVNVPEDTDNQENNIYNNMVNLPDFFIFKIGGDIPCFLEKC